MLFSSSLSLFSLISLSRIARENRKTEITLALFEGSSARDKRRVEKFGKRSDEVNRTLIRSNDFPSFISRAGKGGYFHPSVHARRQFIGFLHR